MIIFLEGSTRRIDRVVAGHLRGRGARRIPCAGGVALFRPGTAGVDRPIDDARFVFRPGWAGMVPVAWHLACAPRFPGKPVRSGNRRAAVVVRGRLRCQHRGRQLVADRGHGGGEFHAHHRHSQPERRESPALLCRSQVNGLGDSVRAKTSRGLQGDLRQCQARKPARNRDAQRRPWRSLGEGNPDGEITRTPAPSPRRETRRQRRARRAHNALLDVGRKAARRP